MSWLGGLPPSAGDTSLGQSTRRGLVWSTIAFLATKALGFLSILVLARLLAPAEFGTVAAIVVFLSLIELASDLGMAATVIYEQERGVTDRVQVAFTLNLIFAGALTVVGVAAAPLVAGFFHLENHTGLFRLAATSLLLTGLGNVQDALMLREMAFRVRLIPQLTRAVVRAVVSIALALAGLAASSLVIGMLAGNALWAAMVWKMTGFRPSLRFDRRIARSMASYGGAAALLEALAVVTTRADQLVIGRALGDRALGLYSVAFRVPEFLIDSVSWNVSIVAFPALSRKRATDSENLGRAVLKLVRFQSLYALPAGAGIAILALPLTVSLFGAQWQQAGGVVAAVSLMTAVGAVAFPLGDVFKAIGRQPTLVAFNLVQIPILVAAVVLAAPAGIVVVAWVRFGVRLCFAIVLITSASRAVSVSMRQLMGALTPAAVASLGMAVGAVVVSMSSLPDFVTVAAGAAIGALAAAGAVRLLAPPAFREVVDLVRETLHLPIAGRPAPPDAGSGMPSRAAAQ